MSSCGNGGVPASLPWANVNSAALWKLVSFLEEPENFPKLFGGKIPNFYSEFNDLAGGLNVGTRRKSERPNKEID